MRIVKLLPFLKNRDINWTVSTSEPPTPTGGQPGVFKWHLACCPCVGSMSGCIILQDNFSPYTPTNYYEDAGTWEGNEVVKTGDSAARIRIKKTDPNISHRIKSTVKGYDWEDELEQIVAYYDSNNYLFARVKLAEDAACPGYLSLNRVKEASQTELISKPVINATPDSSHIMMTCYDQETRDFRSTFLGSGVYYRQYGFNPFEDTLHYSIYASGTYAGLGTGTITNSGEFDDLLFTQLDHPEINLLCADCEPSGLNCNVYGLNPITELNNCYWDVTGTPSFNGGAKGTYSALCKYPVRLSSSPDMHASVSFTLGASVSGVSDKIRVFVDALDHDNYHYADIWANTPEGIYASGVNVQFGKRTGGTDSPLGDPWSYFKSEQNQIPNGNIQLCAVDNTINAYFAASANIKNTTLHDGFYAGIVGFGNSKIKSFLLQERQIYSPTGSKCPSCVSCGPCLYMSPTETDEVLQYYKIVFDGIINRAPPGICTNCDAINGTWIVEWDENNNAYYWPSLACVFINDTQINVCDPYDDTESPLMLFFYSDVDGIGIAPPSDGVQFAAELVDLEYLDCISIDNLDIPTLGAYGNCDYTNATATLSIV